MNATDLNFVRDNYMFFRAMFFNNDIPPISEIDFTLNNLSYAIAYSKHNPKPRKSGNVHEISFSRIYKLSRRDMLSVLIHEMIHLWQDVRVKESRYKVCSHFIAHDKVFTAKMNTINMLLAKNAYDLKLSVTAEKEYPIDPSCEAKTPFTIIFIKQAGRALIIKCWNAYTDKIIKGICASGICYHKLFAVKTTSYKFARFPISRSFKNVTALPDFQNNELYEEFVNDPAVKWIKR